MMIWNRPDPLIVFDGLMSDIYLLITSILTLAVGPLLQQVARRVGSMQAILDGFVFIAISGLILLYVIPGSIALGGWLAVLGGLLGLLVPSLIENRLHGLARQAHMVALVLALSGIMLHGFVDGLALTAPEEKEGAHVHSMLPLAVILHRLPVGLTIWILLRPLYGKVAAMATLGLIALATVAGFALGGTVFEGVDNWVSGIFQALVAGSLLHVVMHRSHPHGEEAEPAKGGRLQAGLGALGGLVLLWGITWSHGAESMLWQGGGILGLGVLFSLILWRRGSHLYANGHEHHHCGGKGKNHHDVQPD